jgi:2-polyprenyl-6-methoxyphenol hydroxylase-like FAD-dependent oxidoreductase
MTLQTTDVVIVGGGIAGSALAAVLAREGYEVFVLERQTAYRDKVRGEFIVPWGVAELLQLSLEDALLAAGGSYVSRAVFYDEVIPPADAEAAAVPLDELLPGIRGALDVGHPEACEALIQAASVAGATVVRGISDVRVSTGKTQHVRYKVDGFEHGVRCRLIVGADARLSTVRRQLSIKLNTIPPRTMGGGMLVDQLYSWPGHKLALGTEGDLHYFIFPRANGRVRLYLLYTIEQKSRFQGPDRQTKFLDSYRFHSIPGSEAIAASRPAGPCAFYPMDDSWTDTPYAEGVVLIGDAAGWNNPIIGQGLSIALRDVRIVADLLQSRSDWSAAAFESYGEERRERMRRLRLTAELATDIRATFTAEAAARRKRWMTRAQKDFLVAAPMFAIFLGPEKVPPETFEQHNMTRILTLS